MSLSSVVLSVRRFTTTFPSAFTFTTTSPIVAVFSFAEEAFGTFTSSSFSLRAALKVRRKKIRSSKRTSTRGQAECPGAAGPRVFGDSSELVFKQHRGTLRHSLVVLQGEE